MTYTPSSFTPSSFTASNEVPKKSWLEKAGAAAPGVMGTVGGTVGSLMGPAGSAVGAGIGTAAGHVVKDVFTPEDPNNYTGNTKGGFAELNEQGRKASTKKVTDALRDAEIAAATAYFGTKYLGGVKKGSGIIGKGRNLLPTNQLAQAGGELTKKSAEQSFKEVAKRKLLDDIIKATPKDPTVISSLKNILSAGTDAATQKTLRNASLDQVKELVLNNPQLLKNVPTTMVEALGTRSTMSAMSSWPTFIQNLINKSAEPGKSAAAKIIRNAINTQLKTIPGVAKGDLMVQAGKMGSKALSAYLAKTALGKIIPGAKSLMGGGE